MLIRLSGLVGFRNPLVNNPRIAKVTFGMRGYGLAKLDPAARPSAEFTPHNLNKSSFPSAGQKMDWNPSP